MIKIRLVKGDVKNNNVAQFEDINLYDWAIPFASTLIVWEFNFTYRYNDDCECVFTIDTTTIAFEDWMSKEGKIDGLEWEYTDIPMSPNGWTEIEG